MSENILITTYTFYHRQYLLKLNSSSCLELVLTDKQTGEEWECSYDIAYVENLTRKTGNFKQFEIFTTMLKSGLLKTSECISLDLLTNEDLESMRVRKVKSSSRVNMNSNNRRYLIVTYCVEFDNIKYPIPLDYCGLPDPAILQATVRKLEAKLSKTQEVLSMKSDYNERKLIKSLERRIDALTMENNHLNDEVKRLGKLVNKHPGGQILVLEKAIIQMEKSVQSERHLHHKLVQKLQSDKMMLANELKQYKRSEKTLKYKIQDTSNIVKNNSQNRKIKKLSSQDMKEGTRKQPQRSRSASPRIIHLDKQFVASRRPSNDKIQAHSRSSSASSKRERWNNCSGSESQFHIGYRGSSPSSGIRGSASSLQSAASITCDTNKPCAKERGVLSNGFSTKSSKVDNRFNRILKRYS